MMKKTLMLLLSLLMILSLTACGSAEQPSAEQNAAEDVEISAAQPEATDALEQPNVKVLVAYFSATNTTATVAEHLADGLQADLYRIIPEEPYTDADLDYNDNNSTAHWK